MVYPGDSLHYHAPLPRHKDIRSHKVPETGVRQIPQWSTTDITVFGKPSEFMFLYFNDAAKRCGSIHGIIAYLNSPSVLFRLDLADTSSG